jgi:hypothetical protein
MTIAVFGLPLEASEALCAKLAGIAPNGTWVCEGVLLAVPN